MKAKQAILFTLENVLHFYLLCPLAQVYFIADVIAITLRSALTLFRFFPFSISATHSRFHFTIIVCHDAK